MIAILIGLLCVQDADPELANKENPRLKVRPVEEPVLLIDEKVETRPGFVAALPNGGGFIFDRKDAAGRRMTGVAVPGIVLVTKGMVELFGCGAGGKEHETVLRLECDVQSLDLALTSAGFRRGRLPTKGDLSEAGQGSRVIILIQWTAPDGSTVTHRSEDLVVSVRRNAPMPRVGWTYVAHWAEVPDPLSPKGDKKHKILAAANTQSYVTTFRDRSALLDNPLEEAVDDTLFAANYMVLPKPGTPVRVIFRTPAEVELKDIAALEKSIAAEAKDFHEDDRDKKQK
ncbi:MAG TPA: YdjY domain-containing protein [Planctomycetota bacterium]